MSSVIVTGIGGLVGGAVARKFHDLGFRVIGIDNDMRSQFFGQEASVRRNLDALKTLTDLHLYEYDIRSEEHLRSVYSLIAHDLVAVIHAAAQPSHDWAATDVATDFDINAVATLRLLQMTWQYAPEARFIFMSTNKVYGDSPNSIDLVESDTRWIPDPSSRWASGIDESMSVDDSLHSFFGVSKLAADLMVQEYGKNLGMRTVVLRGGCLTGPTHAGTELHGFLSHLVKSVVWGREYTVFGHKGKQVRDNIHSVDLSEAIARCAFEDLPAGSCFNIGGGSTSNTSMLEAISAIQELSSKSLNFEIRSDARKGDHIWYVTDTSRIESALPGWKVQIPGDEILSEMVGFEMWNRSRK